MKRNDNKWTGAPDRRSYKDRDIKILVVEPRNGNAGKSYTDYERELTAIRSLNAGTWTLNVLTNSLLVCNKCRQILPVCNEKNVKASRLNDLVAGGYGKHILETILSALKTSSFFDVELPMLISNTKPKWVRITGGIAINNQNMLQTIHGTIEDISERKNGELLRQDYAAMVSHDLRSPLSIIKLYLQMCGRELGPTRNTKLQEMLEKAQVQIHKMSGLIDCYLESSAMDQGKINHSPVWFDIKKLLNEVIADVYILNPGRIIFLKSAPSVEVYADREKIEQVIQNLLGNAIKYSSRLEVITVYYAIVGTFLRVVVEDKGIGIDSKDQEKIFERFYRADFKNKASVKGYGIGLYISKEIIKRHNGDMWIESEVDKGSKFIFSLPLHSI